MIYYLHIFDTSLQLVSSLYQSESSLKSKYLINYVINNQSIVTMFYHQMNETLSPF